MIELEDRDDLSPICPYCDKEIRKILETKVNSKLGVRYLYFCEHCQKVLGVSHRKGFWMG